MNALGATARYVIRVDAHLDARWTSWLDGHALTRLPDGTTDIVAEALDQSALHGLLDALRNAGLDLISVTRVDPTGDGSERTS